MPTPPELFPQLNDEEAEEASIVPAIPQNTEEEVDLPPKELVEEIPVDNPEVSSVAEEVPNESPEQTPPEELQTEDISSEESVVLPETGEQMDFSAFEDFEEEVFGETPATESIESYDDMENWGKALYETQETVEPQVEVDEDKALAAAMDTAGRKANFYARRASGGVANLLDLPVTLLDLVSSGSVGAGRIAQENTSGALQKGLMHLETMNPMLAVKVMLQATTQGATGNGEVDGTPRTARAMLEEVYPDQLPNGFWELGTGMMVEGAVEGAVLAFSMVKYAKGMKNVKEAPEFLQDTLSLAKENPMSFVSGEGWSGAFAALSSTAAMEWASANLDNPEAAPFIALVAAAAGGTIKDPTKLVTTPTGAALRHGGSMAVVGKSLVQKGVSSTRELVSNTLDRQTIDDLVANNMYAKILAKAGRKITGPDAETIVKSLEEQLAESPELLGMVDELASTLNVMGPGTFDSDLARAGAVRDATGVEITLGNVSRVADRRGVGRDFEKIDTNEAMRVAEKNREATRKYFDNMFAKGSVEDLHDVEEVLRDAYNNSFTSAIVHQRAVEVAADNYHHALSKNIEGEAAKFRAEYDALKKGMNSYVTDLYRIDPTNKIKIQASSFKSILEDVEFMNPTITPTGDVLRKAYGKALADTLKTKMASKNFKPSSKVTPEIVARIATGDMSAVAEIPKQSRVIHFQDASGMIKSLRKARSKAKEDTTGGGGDYAHLSGILSRTLDDWDASLRASGNGDAADKFKVADEFYRDYMDGFFDPKNTHAGQLLEKNKPTHFAVKSHDGLDSLLQDPDALSKFIKLTDPKNTDGGAVLADIKDTRFGRFIEKANLDLEKMAPESFVTLRTALADHIIHRASQAAADSPDAPREAMRNWRAAHRDSLNYLPEVDSRIQEMISSPSLNTVELQASQTARYNSELELKRTALANMFGPGGVRGNVLNSLKDTTASKYMDEVFSVSDPSGRLRKTLVAEAVSSAIRVTDEGVLDVSKVEKFLEDYGRGLEIVGGKKTIENLEMYKDSLAIAKRSETGKKALDFSQPIDESWILANASKMWTNLRQSMAMGISKSWLFINQGAQEATKALKKLDADSQKKMGQFYVALITDPDKMADMISVAKRIQNADTVAARRAAEESMSLRYGFMGMPVTAPLTQVNDVSEEIQEEPTVTSEYTVVEEDGSETEAVVEGPNED